MRDCEMITYPHHCYNKTKTGLCTRERTIYLNKSGVTGGHIFQNSNKLLGALDERAVFNAR